MKRQKLLWEIGIILMLAIVCLSSKAQSISDYQKVIEKQDKLELMLKQREPIHTHTILIGWTIAPIMNGLMDWESDSPETFPIQSNPHFWNHQISWQYNENIMGYHLDAWHIEKTIMIVALSIPCAELLHHQYPLIKNKFWDKVLWTAIIGIWWDGIFLISYKKN